MKILVLTNFGMGLYRFRKELLEKMINQGYDVTVSFPQDEYVPLLEKLGCKFVETKVSRRGTNPVADLQLLSSYIALIKSERPDYVLTYTIKPNVYGGLACQITKTPYIPNVTGLGTAIMNGGPLQTVTLQLYKQGLRKAQCVFFQNRENEQFFQDRKIVNSQTHVLPGSGVNLKEHCFEEYPSVNGTVRFLFIGRIMKDKGINELLKAAKEIKQSYSNVMFDIVGFCEEEHMNQLQQLTADGIIQYHGQQKDVHTFIKNAHAIILPSYHEGTSNILLESASTGRPILASNISGCKETFNEGESGFGFKPKNTQDLIETINKFIQLPYERKKMMGIAGRKKIEAEYDRNIVVDLYLQQIECEGEKNNELIRQN